MKTNNNMSQSHKRSGGGVLGNGLGSLGDGVLGELSWEEESDGSLDLSGGQSVLSVVSNKSGGLVGDLLEDVVDEGVHDGHGSLGDTGLWVNLLQDSVDVDGEGLGSLSSSSWGLGSSSLSWGVSSGFSGHCIFKLLNPNPGGWLIKDLIRLF